MRFMALALDYDGTLASDGVVAAETVAALEQVKASGRRLILVSGRRLADLGRIFPRLELFERVVAENGGLLYTPEARDERLLTRPADESLVRALMERGVEPLSVGRTIVATLRPAAMITLEAIRELGLELEITFNKGAVMVLPAGVDKGTGLLAALNELGVATHTVIGVGDAENDLAFLDLCGCSVAVANALPLVKERVAIVTTAECGEGVRELVARLLAGDLPGQEKSGKGGASAPHV